MIDLDCKGEVPLEVPLAPSWFTFIDLDISIRIYLVLISLHLDIYLASTSISMSLQPPMLRSTSHRYPYLDLYRYSTGPQAGCAHSQGYSRGTEWVLKVTSTEWVLRGVLNGY
jgi:hypothetical protein